MGEQLVQLDVEAKAVRGALRPALDGRGRGNRVEARVELHGFEPLCIEAEAVVRRQALRVPVLDEPRVSPARGPDDDGHPLIVAGSTRASDGPRAAGADRG